MESKDSNIAPGCSHGPSVTVKNTTEKPEKDNLPDNLPDKDKATIPKAAQNVHPGLHLHENIPRDDTNAAIKVPSLPSAQSIEIATHLFSGSLEKTPSDSQCNVVNKTSKEVVPEKQDGFKSVLPFLLDCRNTNNNKVVTTQPMANSNLPSSSQPPSLFIQALSKVNESSLGVSTESFRNQLGLLLGQNPNAEGGSLKSDELPAPDSLTSAPPSYSFVLRQSNARARRPRLMGTFIPSPSFITQTPPPNYATAFDIYVDNAPTPPVQVYNYGFTSMQVVCPECGYAGMTVVDSRITLCTHLCAVILCLFCCWICVPLPYLMRSCKDVYHYCRQCSNYLGMYCPTNPENAQRHRFEINRRNMSPRSQSRSPRGV